MEACGPRYDALIVDEGQDFRNDWWFPLLMLLKDPDNAIFHVFYDDNQAIYRKPGGLPAGTVSVQLHEIRRNTAPIFEAVKAFYRGDEIVCAGPDGPEVETVVVTAQALRAELSRVLHRLIMEGNVAASDVVVLTPYSADRSEVAGTVGAFTVTSNPRGRHDVKLESIYRFKGLDAKAVVLCEVNRFADETFTKLMYVGCSRARTYLAVLLTEA